MRADARKPCVIGVCARSRGAYCFHALHAAACVDAAPHDHATMRGVTSRQPPPKRAGGWHGGPCPTLIQVKMERAAALRMDARRRLDALFDTLFAVLFRD
jgi:hypothetical protein